MLSTLSIHRPLAFMQKKGFSPETVLRGSGIECQALGDTVRFVKPAQYRAVVDNIINLTADQGVGFDLGLDSSLSQFGAVGHALMTCRTIMDTQRLWIRFGESLAGVSGKFEVLSEGGDEVFLVVRSEGRGAAAIFDTEQLLGITMQLGSALIGEPAIIRRAEFSFSEPAYVERYQELLKCPIIFDCDRTVLVLERAWARRPILSYDADFHTVCMRRCEDELSRLNGAGRITNALQGLFFNNESDLLTLQKAANALQLSQRTLRRRLYDEGTTYRQEVALFRNERVKHYLREGHATKRIAVFLGFSDASALRHEFKKWNEQTINEYKATLPISTMVENI